MKVQSRGLLLTLSLLMPSLLLPASDAKPKAVSSAPKIPAAKSSIDSKVEDLLKKMTIEEKIGQMTQYHQSKALDEKATVDVKAGKVGSMLSLFGAKATNAAQKVAVEGSRLHIPVLFGLDVIHGSKTFFPLSRTA